MKLTLWTLLLAAGMASCGTRTAKSAPVTAYVAPVEEMAAALEAEPADEPEAVITWDKTVHDFGDVSVSDGPLTCTFTVTNVSNQPVAILEVVSSCGCTDVQWTREPLQPGKSGTISATFKNEDGPTAFDKTLTVYITGVRRPVILRLRGVVHEKKKSLSELYGAQKLGDFGIKTRSLQAGTLRQGLSVSETVTVANLGQKPLQVDFAKVSPQLSLSVTPNPIPAGTTATLAYTLRADTLLYGRNFYAATPVLNGKEASDALEIGAWTQQNFASWSPEQRADAAVPMFDASTFNFGIVPSGTVVEALFTCTNKGKSLLHFYKADAESPALQPQALPDIAPGQKGSFALTLDTSSLPKGDTVILVSLTTNAPLRPLVNLFVAGEIK